MVRAEPTPWDVLMHSDQHDMVHKHNAASEGEAAREEARRKKQMQQLAEAKRRAASTDRKRRARLRGEAGPATEEEREQVARQRELRSRGSRRMREERNARRAAAASGLLSVTPLAIGEAARSRVVIGRVVHFRVETEDPNAVLAIALSDTRGAATILVSAAAPPSPSDYTWRSEGHSNRVVILPTDARRRRTAGAYYIGVLGRDDDEEDDDNSAANADQKGVDFCIVALSSGLTQTQLQSASMKNVDVSVQFLPPRPVVFAPRARPHALTLLILVLVIATDSITSESSTGQAWGRTMRRRRRDKQTLSWGSVKCRNRQQAVRLWTPKATTHSSQRSAT